MEIALIRKEKDMDDQYLKKQRLLSEEFEGKERRLAEEQSSMRLAKVAFEE